MTGNKKSTSRRQRKAVKDVRPFPPFLNFFMPRFVWEAVCEFVTSWAASRRTVELLVGLPAIATAIACFVLIASDSDSQLQQIAAIERAYIRGVESDDLRAQRVCLDALIARVPNKPQYRFRLAMHYKKLGANTSANAILDTLIGRHLGFAPARMWLAERELKNGTRESGLRASEHYRAVLDKDPGSLQANARLGQIYVGLKQPLLAEPLLKKAAAQAPEFGIQYAQTLVELGRIPEAQQAAENTTAQLRDMVTREPGNVERRIQWSTALRLSGRNGEAERAIREGRALNDDPLLRHALARLYLLRIQGETNRGILTLERRIELTRGAFQLAPDSSPPIKAICQLAALRFFECDGDALETAVVHLSSQLESDPSQPEALHLQMGWLMFLQGRNDDAVEQLRTAASAGQYKLALAKLYALVGRYQESITTAEAALKECLECHAANPTIDHTIRLVQSLVFLKNWEQAYTVLVAADPDDSQLQALAFDVRQREFDYAGESGASDADLLKIAKAMHSAAPPGDFSIIRRLANLAFEKSATGEWASGVLHDELATGDNSPKIHALLGTNALRAENYEAASLHFEFAHKAQPGDPVVCNNLAFSLLKRPAPDLSRAYQLASQALSRLPEHPEILKTRGRILLAQEKYEEALADLQVALSRTKDATTLHELLAEAYRATGNDEMSSRHIELSRQSSDDS